MKNLIHFSLLFGLFFACSENQFTEVESRFHYGKLGPAIGAEFGYNVFLNIHMNVGMDNAVRKEDWRLYFRIGEAF